MKTLHLRTPTITIGPARIIGIAGLKLAREEGINMNLGHVEPVAPQGLIDEIDPDLGAEIRFQKLFLGTTGPAAGTALMFCEGLGYVPAVSCVPELDEPIVEIMTAGFRSCVADKLDELAAAIKAHGRERIERWAKLGRSALRRMFDAMEDGQIAVGFFHGLMLEMLVWTYGANPEARDSWFNLRPMEGLTFVCDDAGEIRVTGKITVKT